MIFLFGAPGVGKGTQGELLVERYNFKKFSMGDVLREEISLGSPVGKNVEVFLKNGELAPDNIVFEIVEDYVLENIEHNILFDGFPRNINQAIELEKLLARHNEKIDIAIELQLPKEEIIKRTLGRLYCSNCGAIFNEVTNPPKVPNICDNCGSVLVKRKDDNLEVVTNRLKVYEEMTKPLSEYYKSLGVYVPIDASGSKEEVLQRIIQVIDGIIK
ncbi:MAG: adenylate kinase family protein [bacterium]